MRSICFYFQVHQPYRLKQYRFFDIGKDHEYYDEYQNGFIARRVADKCYLPMNQLLLDAIKEFGSMFKVSFSISGTALDQFEQYTPDVIDSFKRLAETGCVEFLSETYTHSLSALKSKDEFTKQVNEHQAKIMELFGVKPTTFRNTELIYSDGIGAMVADMGFETMLTEGAKHILGWKSPNYMYANAINPKLKLLLKNFQLSDDIAFRFSQQSWESWPLTTEKFVGWLNQIDEKEEVVNLFMDYETFGEHQWPETGIFDFMRALPERVLSNTNFTFNTPSELSKHLQPVSAIHVPYPISWADEERDLTAWLGNELQDEAFDQLYKLEDRVKQCDDAKIQKDWEYLQTSDHFYYMCTKFFSDGDVHMYFNPYGTPYEAFINYMNVLSDFIIRIDDCLANKPKKKKDSKPEKENKKEVKKEKEEKQASAKKHRFSDLEKMSNVKLKTLLAKFDASDLIHALHNSSDKLKDKVLSNISNNVLKEFENLSEEIVSFSEKERKNARRRIMNQLKKLK
ncbi:MAG: alpha-amylase [Bacteroidetes bacterium]|nr:MAG: alpha-amylase [Bacteroidota bacterium]